MPNTSIYKELYRKALKKIGEMSDEQLEAFVSEEGGEAGEAEETNLCQYCGEELATDKLNGRLIGNSCWNVYVTCTKAQWEQILTIMRNAEGQKRNS